MHSTFCSPLKLHCFWKMICFSGSPHGSSSSDDDLADAFLRDAEDGATLLKTNVLQT